MQHDNETGYCTECNASSWFVDYYDGFSICSNCGHRTDYDIKIYDEDIANKCFMEKHWEQEW